MATKAQTISAPEAPPPRQIALKVASVHVEHYGHSCKHVVVNLPDDFQFTDLNEMPEELFKNLQKDRTRALAEHDRLELRGKEFVIYASVNYADHERVTLFDIRRVSKPRRDLSLFSDNTYEVRWTEGGGYNYFRKSDGVKMSGGTYPTPEAAKSALMREQYPARL